MTDTLSTDVEGLFPIEQVEQQPEQVEAIEPAPASVETQEQPQEGPAEVQAEQVEQEDKPKDHTVPLATFLDKRDEAKELKRQLAEARAEVQRYQTPQQPVEIPDPYERPKEYQAYIQNQMEDNAFNMRLEMSGHFAEQVHGKDTVDAAVTWAQEQGRNDPTFGVRLRNQPNPVGWVVEQHKRELFYNQYGSDPSALAAQGAPQANQVQPAPQMVAPVTTQRQAPPRSLAAAPSTAGHQTIPTGSILDSMKFGLD